VVVALILGLFFSYSDTIVPRASLVVPSRSTKQVGVWVMTFFNGDDKFHHWADVKRRHGAMPLNSPFSCSDPKRGRQGVFRDPRCRYRLRAS